MVPPCERSDHISTATIAARHSGHSKGSTDQTAGRARTQKRTARGSNQKKKVLFSSLDSRNCLSCILKIGIIFNIGTAHIRIFISEKEAVIIVEISDGYPCMITKYSCS